MAGLPAPVQKEHRDLGNFLEVFAVFKGRHTSNENWLTNLLFIVRKTLQSNNENILTRIMIFLHEYFPNYGT